jgi:hypothetical protein
MFRRLARLARRTCNRSRIGCNAFDRGRHLRRGGAGGLGLVRLIRCSGGDAIDCLAQLGHSHARFRRAPTGLGGSACRRLHRARHFLDR